MKTLLRLFLFLSAVPCIAQYTSYSPAAIQAGAGDPVTLNIPCNSTVATTSTAYEFDNTTITTGPSISKCAWDPTSSTYHWFAPAVNNPIQTYTSVGLQSQVKCFYGNTTSAATTGAWSISYSTMPITTLLYVDARALATSGLAGGLNNASVNAASATAASGYVYSGTTLSVLGATIIVQPVSTTVYVIACGV